MGDCSKIFELFIFLSFQAELFVRSFVRSFGREREKKKGKSNEETREKERFECEHKIRPVGYVRYAFGQLSAQCSLANATKSRSVLSCPGRLNEADLNIEHWTERDLSHHIAGFKYKKKEVRKVKQVEHWWTRCRREEEETCERTSVHFARYCRAKCIQDTVGGDITPPTVKHIHL